jgi:hypothetical protein
MAVIRGDARGWRTRKHGAARRRAATMTLLAIGLTLLAALPYAMWTARRAGFDWLIDPSTDDW